VLPRSHRKESNPTGDASIDPLTSFKKEINVQGDAGSVLVMDSRMWHATSPNRMGVPRVVALVVRYAPWWLNLEVLRPESDERARMVTEAGRRTKFPLSRRRFMKSLVSVLSHYIDIGFVVTDSLLRMILKDVLLWFDLLCRKKFVRLLFLLST
jgi:hypothetical protein